MTHKRTDPEICVMTKSWRYSAGWFAQMIAQSIADRGARIAYVAPRAEPEMREPRHPLLMRFEAPRELVDSESRARRATASIRRICYGFFCVLALRWRTRNFVFSIPEPLPITLLLFALLRLTGARVIFVVHDPTPHAWTLPRSLRTVERTAHAWSYKLATRLVALTPPAKDALVSSFGIRRDKVVVIPHGALPITGVRPLPYARKLLIFGALRRNKGVLEAIEGVLQSRRDGLNIQLIIAGEPLKQEFDYWQACVEAINLDPLGFDVRVGFVRDEVLPLLVNEVDAFVLAYRNFHSQSGVGVLAALAERPVIGSRAGGLGELFDLGMTGEVLSDSFTALEFSRAVRAFYSIEHVQWQERAREGARLVASSLDWNAIGDAYIALARSEPAEASS